MTERAGDHRVMRVAGRTLDGLGQLLLAVGGRLRCYGLALAASDGCR